MHALAERYASLSFTAMGCRFEILIDARRSGLDRAECCAIAEEMRGIVFDWHKRLSVFEEASIVSRINRAGAGVEIPLDEDMFALCRLCDRFRLSTHGAFNIAAGTLMHTHGFRAPCEDPFPGSLDLSDAYTLDERRRSITKSHGRVSLDMGAIAKGFVLDLIRDELISYGIQHAFIHGGTSSITGLGDDELGQPWLVRAGNEEQSARASCHIALSGLSAGVSEHRSRMVQRGDDSLGHVMDPRTGEPAAQKTARMVCVHPSAAAADAYSTATCADPGLMGPLSGNPAEPCTFVAFDINAHTSLHDPLGVVRFV